MIQFKETDRKFVLAMCEALGKQPNGQWFRSVTPSDVWIGGVQEENDFLSIKDCSVQVVMATVPAIVPREQPEFIVSVPVVVRGNHWEPDDVDIVELCRTQSLRDALRELYLSECGNAFDNVCQGVDYEMEKS